MLVFTGVEHLSSGIWKGVGVQKKPAIVNKRPKPRLQSCTRCKPKKAHSSHLPGWLVPRVNSSSKLRLSCFRYDVCVLCCNPLLKKKSSKWAIFPGFQVNINIKDLIPPCQGYPTNPAFLSETLVLFFWGEG